MLESIILLAIGLVYYLAYNNSESDESFNDEELERAKSYKEYLEKKKNGQI